MDFTALLSRLSTLFLSILVGYAAAKRRIITPETSRHLSDVVVNLANPLLILSSVMNSSFALSNWEVLKLTAIAASCYILLAVISVVIPGILKVEKADAGLYRFLFVFSNIGFIGYPVIQSLYGSDAVFYASIFNLPFNLLCWSYGVYLICSDGEKMRFSWKNLSSPAIPAGLLAYAVYFLRLSFPAFIGDTVSFLGNLTSPLAMLIIGCALAQIPIRGIWTNWRIYLLAVLKMVAVPVAAYYLLSPILQNELLMGVTVVILAMPAAANTTVLCCQYGKNQTLAANAVFLTTLFSVVSIPALVYCLFL